MNLDLEHMTIIYTSGHNSLTKLNMIVLLVEFTLENSFGSQVFLEQYHSKLYFHSYPTATLDKV